MSTRAPVANFATIAFLSATATTVILSSNQVIAQTANSASNSNNAKIVLVALISKISNTISWTSHIQKKSTDNKSGQSKKGWFNEANIRLNYYKKTNRQIFYEKCYLSEQNVLIWTCVWVAIGVKIWYNSIVCWKGDFINFVKNDRRRKTKPSTIVYR